MKTIPLISAVAVTLIASLIFSCSSRTVDQGRYYKIDDKLEFVVVLPDNKIQFVSGGYGYLMSDYRISGDKLVSGGGEFFIEGNALVKLGTRERYVRE